MKTARCYDAMTVLRHDSITAKTANRKTFIFTLIELLVVIAIMSILMAMLLPGLKSVKDRTKSLTCLNNLRTIGQVTIMYSSDYNGWLTAPYNKVDTWGTVLYKGSYITSKNTFYCPSYYIPTNMNLSYSYGMTGYTNESYTRISPFVPSPSTSLTLSEVFIYIDSRAFLTMDVGWYHVYRNNVDNTQKKPCIRHNKNANAAFADGHVDSLNSSVLLSKYNYSAYP